MASTGLHAAGWIVLRHIVATVSLAVLSACTGASGGAPSGANEGLTRDQLLDPKSCEGCHPKHYREWASSMHAYASSDPVFIAMNRRGQRETGGDGDKIGGQLGGFCVKCHAPMAQREGATQDGLNLDEVPEHLKGVTCYFCHNAVGVGEHFNNDLRLANDTTMRGGIADPVQPGAHRAAYSRFHDRNSSDSSLLCGGCHDIVTPAGVHLERTFAEYEGSLFSKQPGFETCQGCHMDGRKGVAANDPATKVPLRIVHEHLWPGVDVALHDFPDREIQQRAIECALSLNARIMSIVHDGIGGFTVKLETSAGHNQPSGAAQDRRMWLEFIAYDKEDHVLFESGNLGDGEREDKPPTDPGYDRNLTLFRDWTYDERGEHAHMFWKAAPSAMYPDGYRSLALPAATAPMMPHSIEAKYQVPHAAEIAKVTARLRIRSIGVDVLQDLVSSGDLDAAVISQVPTFALQGAAFEWTLDTPLLRSLWPDELVCPNSYLCLLQPDAGECTHP